MSAVSIQPNLTSALTYARPVRAVARPQATSTLTQARAHHTRDIPSLPSSGLGLAALTDAIDPVARASAALAIADDALAQIHDALATDHPQIDALAAAATFQNKPLLDGSFTARVNSHAITLPSFRSADLPATAATSLVSKTRAEIEAFRTNAIHPAANAALGQAERLIPESPSVDDASSAATNALLVRARVLIDAGAVAAGVTARAHNVLALVG